MATRRELLKWLAGGTFGVLATGLPASASTSAITVSTLIDGNGSPPSRSTVLVLAGDRILAVGRHPAVPKGVPAAAPGERRDRDP